MHYKKIAALLFAGIVLISSASAQESDISNHWAEPVLNRAISEGLLKGETSASGVQIHPDAPLTYAEMTILINRVLHAQDTSRTYTNVIAGEWYVEDANRSVSLGVLPVDGSVSLGNAATRGEAIIALVNGFGLAQATPNEQVLQQYPDLWEMTPAQRRAAAVLTELGVLSGDENGKLQVNQFITRAEFVSLLYRVLDAPVCSLDGQKSGASYAIFTTQTHSIPSDAWYQNLILRGDGAQARSPLPSQQLTLATTGTPVVLDDSQQFSRVTIGGGTGDVTLAGDVTRQVEVTGSGRTISLSDVHLDTLLVSGTDNQIIIDADSAIDTLRILQQADRNQIILDGQVTHATLSGSYSHLSGNGFVQNGTTAGKYGQVQITSANWQDLSDNGLDGVQIALHAPQVTPGGIITATATITGIDRSRVCAVAWYLDEVSDPSFQNPSVPVSAGQTLSYQRSIPFTRDMPLSHKLRVQLSYLNQQTGLVETVSAQTTVTIENYPPSHYLPDPATVLKKVHPTYRAGNQDYTPEEKVVFVNAKGYKSPTKYLLWISRSAQMVNVFEGSAGNWKLIHEFPCATGKSSSPTPIGVTHVTYKQTAWVTPAYTCRPIVRFYPGTGYAFHSRLYYPGTNKLKDATIGRPVSAGCVRMMDDGINWIYDNVPSKTTVVIY